MSYAWEKAKPIHEEHRLLGHVRVGKPVRVMVETRDGVRSGIATSCMCGYQLIRILDGRGHVIGYKRKYPDGYLNNKGEGRADNDAGRRHLMKRLSVARPNRRS